MGASAGGLEALEQFFRKAPTDLGICYVVVQHLSPDYESLMDKLLSRETSMPVRLIEDGTQLTSNAIYLLPPKKEVILSDSRLLLAERSVGRDVTFPIDSFFRSLAQDAGPRAIAVVLSGTGSDGSRGICDVHRAGGYVMVQNDITAKFDGMPRSACATGIVDTVLAPGDMGAAIAGHVESPLAAALVSSAATENSLDQPTYAVLSLLKKSYEIDFNFYKTSTLSRRIERRVMLSGSQDVPEYTRRLRNDAQELNALYRDLLIGVTAFFRDREVFERLELDVIPALLSKLIDQQELRAWVVGGATGEEAYSLAILLAEASEAIGVPGRIKVFASDVHQESLDYAGRGVYPEEALSGLTTEQRQKYFVEKIDGCHASAELRKMVVFVHHNVITNAPFTNLDLICCRNLFVYFTAATQRKVLSLFHFGMKTGGALCLGLGESASELEHEFEPIDEKLRIYRKHRDVSLPASLRMPFLTAPAAMTVATNPAVKAAVLTPTRDLLTAYDKLLAQFMPPSVLLSPNNELLHTFGDASRFLRIPAGRPSQDVLDLVDPALRTAVSAAVRRASTDEAAATHAELQGDEKTPPLVVKITADQLDDADNRTLVIFEVEEKSPAARQTVEIDVEQISSEEYESLERELQRTKDDLQSTLEESQTTTEELQATNEQLTASNEELQSTNEELHSVNEELYTVNAEHQRKIDELTELTDDMDNLLNSTNIHTIFLDRELSIRRFTPGIADTFNLIPQDVGRRINDFTHNIRYRGLVDSLKQVLETSQDFEQEVVDKNDNWYLLRILPYLTRGQVDGAVVTLINITSLKQAESKLAELSEIVEHSDDAIFRQDVDGTVRTWNRGAERLFGIKAPKVLGNHVSMLGLECCDLEFEQMLGLVVSGQSLDHVEARRVRSQDQVNDLALSISPIRDASGRVIGASTIARDVTKQKQAEAEVLEAVRRRDEFLAMLSHELRNPLAAVLNATDLLSEAGGEAAFTDEAKSVIEHNVRHVARILDDLLDVSRITNDKIKLHREVVDLSSLMIDVVECVQHRIDAKRQELHVENPEQAIYVEGDVGRLQQMQVNLLVNASKYTGEGGRIEYAIEADGDEAIVSIRDTGVGIAPELLDRIFEPFVQAEQTLDRAQGGMGLGLTLVSKVAEAHGGTVLVQSDGMKHGSTFTIRLPATTKRPRQKVESQLAQVDGMRLYIVEDNDGVRTMLARTMELKGFCVETAANGRAALEAIDAFGPSVAVVDIGLPDLNGYEVAKELRRRATHQHLLLVALTGYGREQDREKALAAGFDIHLVKPLDPNELLRAVAEKYASVPSAYSGS